MARSAIVRFLFRRGEVRKVEVDNPGCDYPLSDSRPIGEQIAINNAKAMRLMHKDLGYVPRGDRVLIERMATPAPKEGAVMMPTSQQRPPDEGTVVAVGPGIHDLQIGDHVCFLEHAGYEVEVDGKTYLQMRDEEIVGKRLKGNASNVETQENE